MTTFEDGRDLGRRPFAAVLSAGGKPDELWKVNGGYDGCLFGFDDGNWKSWVKVEEVFAEETLLEIVFFEFEGRMCPGDVAVWLFNPAASGWIVKHDFAIADVALGVDLPEDAGAEPIFGGTYKIGIDEVDDGGGIENGFKEGDEVVAFVVGQGGLEGGGWNE